MTARYLIRLDDACPTMDRQRWDRVEAALDEMRIRPLVAVIPDNRDPDMFRSPPDPEFWNRVRNWQAKGWAIAMHGLHHLYHRVDRRRLIVPLHDRSEFAGLEYEEQAAMIAKSWAIFEKEGVRPSIWIAPGHAFDRLTVKAIRAETPIRIISDGLAVHHFCEQGFVWVPQQLWQLEPRRAGLWTICLHPNTMDEQQMRTFETQIGSPSYKDRIVGMSDLVLTERRKSIVDRAYPFYFFGRLRLIGALLPSYQRLKRLRAKLLTQ